MMTTKLGILTCQCVKMENLLHVYVKLTLLSFFTLVSSQSQHNLTTISPDIDTRRTTTFPVENTTIIIESNTTQLAIQSTTTTTPSQQTLSLSTTQTQDRMSEQTRAQISNSTLRLTQQRSRRLSTSSTISPLINATTTSSYYRKIRLEACRYLGLKICGNESLTLTTPTNIAGIDSGGNVEQQIDSIKAMLIDEMLQAPSKAGFVFYIVSAAMIATCCGLIILHCKIKASY